MASSAVAPDTRVVIGTLRSFSQSTFTATVQPDGSLATFLPSVPVSADISPSLLAAGARVAVLMFDAHNATDALVVGVVSPATIPPLRLEGSGDPNTVVTAPKGSLWQRTDASSTTTRLYINTDGGTTWAHFTASA